MRSRPLPPIDELRRRLRYEPDTGKLFWLESRRGAWIGREAGTSHDTKGYLVINLQGVLYKVHRIIWAIVHGVDPGDMQIDHINTDKKDNRIENLRLADNGHNQTNRGHYRNNKSGIKGIWWNKKLQKWQVSLQKDNKTVHLGCYKNKIFAGLVYARAAKIHFGEFRRIR